MQLTLSKQQAQLHQFILKTFASSGRSPSLADVQRAFSLNTEEDAERLLAELEQTQAIHRAPGDALVTHAYPFSNDPTPHRVRLASGVGVYAMCAIDALGIPFMLRSNAAIESACLQCKQAVHVDVREGKIAGHAPKGLMVGYVPMGCCSTPATEQCPHINFFCSQEHFAAWAKDNPEHDLKALTLDRALEQGEKIFGAAMNNSSESCCST